MTVVAVPSALLGDRAPRQLHSVCSSLRDRADTTTPAPNLGSAPQLVKHSDTFAHSRIPDSAPRPYIFASSLEKTCRLLPADRGLSDTMSMRFPRAAAAKAAKTRPVRVCRPPGPPRAGSSAPTSSLRTGVPELGQQPSPAGGPRCRRFRHLAATAALLLGMRRSRMVPAVAIHGCHGSADVRPCCQERAYRQDQEQRS